MNKKRIFASLLGGIIAAIICLVGGMMIGKVTEITSFVMAGSIFNRLMIGFMIGITGLRMNYILRGALIGFLVSLITSLSFLSTSLGTFILYTSMGILYGVMTDILATKVFKADV